MPSLGEAPNGGAEALGYLGLFQVTRCKSETASRRYRRNGYVPRSHVAVTAETDMYPNPNPNPNPNPIHRHRKKRMYTQSN